MSDQKYSFTIDDQYKPINSPNIVRTICKGPIEFKIPYNTFLAPLPDLLNRSVSKIKQLEADCDASLLEIQRLSDRIREQLHPPGAQISTSAPEFLNLAEQMCVYRSDCVKMKEEAISVALSCKQHVDDAITKIVHAMNSLPDSGKYQMPQFPPTTTKRKRKSNNLESDGSYDHVSSTNSGTPIIHFNDSLPTPVDDSNDHVNVTGDPTIKCFCGWVTSDDAIGCDNPDGCEYGEWFHWRCVNIVEAPPPSEPWICPGCRKSEEYRWLWDDTVPRPSFPAPVTPSTHPSLVSKNQLNKE